jgi:hypothetical protein
MEKRVFSNELIPLVKELLEDGQDVMLTVSGNSMRPFYHHHKTVVKLRYPKENLQKFDVILYQVHNQYKLHRIYKIHDDMYTVYGDALVEKEMISKVQVFGVVLSHMEKKKTVDRHNKNYLFQVRMWALLKPFRRLLLRLFGG